MGLDARKPVFGGLRTPQEQTRLGIRAEAASAHPDQRFCYLLFGKYHM